MNRIITIVLICFCVSSCVNTSTLADFVNSKSRPATTSSASNGDWLKIVSALDQPINHSFEKEESTFIPALLYWGWSSTIACELDMDMRLNSFHNSLQAAIDSSSLKNIIGDGTLELNLTQVPGKFVYENRGDVLILIIAYTTSVSEIIYPEKIPLEVEFRWEQDGILVRDGITTVPNAEQEIANVWKSTRKFTWLYLDLFQEEVDQMCAILVQELETVLTNDQ